MERPQKKLRVYVQVYEKGPDFHRNLFHCFTWTRTKDNAINSRGLYQLSYEAICL